MTERDKIDVCLVEMPFSSYAAPSFSLSLLKACLRQTDFSARVLYGSMRFANRCGLSDYNTILNRITTNALAGEAVFASCLKLPLAYTFPEYIREFKQFLPHEHPFIEDSYIERIQQTFIRVQALGADFLNEFADELIAHDPKIVAMASMFFQHNACLALARVLKEKNPGLIVMIGGANCADDAGAAIVRHIPWIDYAFSGEADECFAELCRLLLEKGTAVPDECLPYGTISRKMAAQLIESGEFPFRFTRDLDSIPVPDYDDYFRELELFSLHKTLIPSLLYEFSRGCWWHEKKPCTFCGLNGKGSPYRIKSNTKIIDDLLQLQATCHNRRITLTDNILSPKHLETLLPELSALEEKFYFFAEVKSNLTRENLQDLRQAGFRLMQPGIESLNDGALALMNKGNRAIKHIELLRNAEEEGIVAIWHLLSGFPLEQKSWCREMADLIPKITHIRPPVQFTHIVFSKYSEYYRDSDRYGLNLRPTRGYHYVYPAVGDYIQRMAYMFEPSDEQQLSTYLFVKCISEDHRLLSEAIVQWQHKFHPNKDILEMTRVGDRIEILDLRTAAFQSLYSLSGVRKRIYEMSREVIRRTDLTEELASEFDSAAVEAGIDYLLKQSLLIEMEGELLALAMEWKRHEPLAPDKWPRGFCCGERT